MFGRKKGDKKDKVKLSKDNYKSAATFLSYLKPYKGYIAIGWFFLLMSSLTGMLFPILIGSVIGYEGGSNGMQNVFSKMLSSYMPEYSLSNLTILLFIVFGFQALFSFLRVVLFSKVTESALQDLRTQAFDKFLRLPYYFYSKNRTGELISRIATDTNLLQESMNTTIAELFRQLIMVVGGLVVIFMASAKLSLIMLACIPVVSIVAVFFGRFIRNLSKDAQNVAADSNVILEEALSGVLNVRAFGNESFEENRFSEKVKSLKKINIKTGVWRGVFVSFIIFCVFGSIAFVISQGMQMVEDPTSGVDREVFTIFIMMTVMLGASFGSIPDLFAKLQKAIGATDKLMSLIKEDEEEKELTEADAQAFVGLENNIVFEGVNFNYPERPDVQVLKNLSFDINKGETIALVGESGAGKSTITLLLLNLYRVTSGVIKVDGKPLPEIDLDSWRKDIAYVPQEVMLFGGTIRDNIAYGRQEATEEEIIEVAKQANAWNFIKDLPEGLDTEVGTRGIQLSGGQRQRVAIARAILSDPEILLLDEATSALDSESERLVQEALERLMKGRTSVVIAHRLSTITSADKILVFQNGQLVEQGTHGTLSELGGYYAKLSMLQLNG